MRIGISGHDQFPVSAVKNLIIIINEDQKRNRKVKKRKMKNKIFACVFVFLPVFLFTSCVFQSSEMFSTHQSHDYYSWTLTSRLGQALVMAEERYGQRDLSWTLLGVEIYDKISPQTFYLNQHIGQKQIIIQLGRLSTLNRKTALVELSHEVIHILSPLGGKDTVTVFEEGLATYFSIQYLKAIEQPVKPEKYYKDKKYVAAYQLVLRLYNDFDGVDKKIRALRVRNKGFSSIPADQFKKSFPGYDDAFYDFLSGKFSQTPMK